MIESAIVDLVIERGTPMIDTTAFVGFDYGSAAFDLKVRRFRDAASAPLLVLANAGPTAEGVSCSVTITDGIPTSFVRIQINEVTGESLPKTSPAGGDFAAPYDLDITGGGHGKLRRMKGHLIAKASANG